MRAEYQHLIQLQLYRSSEYPCNYLPNQTACSQMVAPVDRVSDQNYSQLIDLGFRRSGLYVYRPLCPNCNACQPYRILVNEFVPNRSQKRCQLKWQALKVSIKNLAFDAEHFALYQRYVQTRHAGGVMADDDEAQYQRFILETPITSFMVEFRDGDRLIMVSLVDQTVRGLSAMYTFFDPDPDYSGIGIFGILWQIQTARQFDLPYVYLGYWIATSPKMRYKQHFQPAELLINGQWQAFRADAQLSDPPADTDTLELL